jgi:hypothetical protein
MEICGFSAFGTNPTKPSPVDIRVACRSSKGVRTPHPVRLTVREEDNNLDQLGATSSTQAHDAYCECTLVLPCAFNPFRLYCKSGHLWTDDTTVVRKVGVLGSFAGQAPYPQLRHQTFPKHRSSNLKRPEQEEKEACKAERRNSGCIQIQVHTEADPATSC